ARGRGRPRGMRAPYARKPQRTTVTVSLFLWGEAARARGESAPGVSEPSTPRRNDDPAGPDAAREPGLPPTGTALAMTIIGVLTLGTIASAVSGVARGIRWLSNIDMALGLVLAVFIFVVGPTVFLMLIPSSIIVLAFAVLGGTAIWLQRRASELDAAGNTVGIADPDRAIAPDG